MSQISLRTVYALFQFFLSIFSSSRKLNKLLTQGQNCTTEKNVTTHSTKQYQLDKARAAAHDLLVEAIYRGYMFEINRPKLVAVGKKSERRPAFSLEEVRALRANFDSWILKGKADSVELRSLLRDYVTILLDTGMRPGTEVAELTWGQIEIKYYPVATKTGEIDRDHSRIESNMS